MTAWTNACIAPVPYSAQFGFGATGACCACFGGYTVVSLPLTHSVNRYSPFGAPSASQLKSPTRVGQTPLYNVLMIVALLIFPAFSATSAQTEPGEYVSAEVLSMPFASPPYFAI